jgi:hypothetical protein
MSQTPPPNRAATEHAAEDSATRRQVKALVELLGKHLDAERVDSEHRSAKFRAWEEQQERVLQVMMAAGPAAGSAGRPVPSSADSDLVSYERPSPAKTRPEEPKVANLQSKCEHLVRTLIKTLRENRAYEDTVIQLTAELAANRERLVALQDAAATRDACAAELQSTREVLLQRTDDLARSRAEVRQRTAALERQAVAERETRRIMQAEKEVVLAQISQQMTDLVAEHEALLDTNEEMFFACERAAGDLRAAVKRGKELEQRAVAAELALEDERVLRANAERELDAARTAEGRLDAAGKEAPFAFAAADRVARLEARLRSDALTAMELRRRADDAVVEALASRDASEQRVSDLENMIRSLKRELAHAVRDATQQALQAQSAKQRLLSIKHDAVAVTNLMSVTRIDTVHVADSHSGDEEVARFVERVTMDLTNLANFLALLRSLDTNPQFAGTIAAVDATESSLAVMAPYPDQSPDREAANISPRREAAQSRFFAPPTDELAERPRSMRTQQHDATAESTLRMLDSITVRRSTRA